MNDNNCTAKDCPVHFRNNMEVTSGNFSAITYVGEYCVFTDVRIPGPETSFAEFLDYLQGRATVWDTWVFKVGEGTLAEAVNTGRVYEYASWSDLAAIRTHQAIVKDIKEDNAYYLSN